MFWDDIERSCYLNPVILNEAIHEMKYFIKKTHQKASMKKLWAMASEKYLKVLQNVNNLLFFNKKSML
ncbi:MAG TPA: hypothetical protein DCF90_03535 [Acinetobacter radioresistens]|nr:hypothetical protein [Acinetobacter radioresistens]